MSANAYNEVPYLSSPIDATHPDRLASVAALFGMEPAPVTACRVLEIGCGSGGNLIPMAYRLPGSRFTGIDLAEQPILEGRRVAVDLGIKNLDLIAMDLRDVGPSFGEFDYIVAHGFYSWIPDDLRDRLLEVCHNNLAPQGVALVSFNALPGGHIRIMLREMLLYHLRGETDPHRRIERALALLRKLGEAHLVSAAWQPMIEQQVRSVLKLDPGSLYHDELAPINDAFLIRDFVDRASRHSLQYLGDAEPPLMFDTRLPLDWVGGDVIEREQYFDYLSFRSFRITLLCRDEVRVVRPASAERMDRFYFSSPAREVDGQIQGMHAVRMADAPEPLKQIAVAMGAVYPQPLSFDELLPPVGDPDTLRSILFMLMTSGFAMLHSHRAVPPGPLSARPRANPLAKWENTVTGVVTWSNHQPRALDTTTRALIGLLDGTRDLDAIATDLARAEGTPPIEEIRARLPHVLGSLSHAGLLE
jgi:SAM-dependent methyltransferase